jgi:hypothetical protein
MKLLSPGPAWLLRTRCEKEVVTLERGSGMAATIACNVGDNLVEYKASRRPEGMYKHEIV